MNTAECKQFLVDAFEFEYCAECGGDSDDHMLCAGPFGAPFIMCKFAPIVIGIVFRHGKVVSA